MAKPENNFIAKVHRKLRDTHCNKNNNPFRSGEADVWYSGKKGDLWVEYKYTKNLRATTLFTPDLSSQQKRWLGNRLDEGRNVAVVVGHESGGTVYRDREWLRPMPFSELQARSMTVSELADWVFEQVGVQCVLLE